MDEDLHVKIRPELQFSPHLGGQEPAYVIEDPARHRFFRIGNREYVFITQLDGKKTVAQALESSTAVLGKDGLSPEQAGQVMHWLAANQLISLSGSRLLEQGLVQERRQERRRQVHRLNLIIFRLALLNPARFIAHLFPWLRWATGWPFFLIWCVVLVLAAWELGSHWQQFIHQSQGLLAARNLAWLWTCWFLLKVLHELSHALTCRKYGGNVYEAGILFIVFIPLTYVDATASWKFASRWQRAHVAAAGMYAELLVAAVAVLFWVQHPTGVGGMMARNVIIVAGVSSILFNANPLMRFDGYYLLSDLTNIANLYAKGLGFVHGCLRFLFLGIRSATLVSGGWRNGFIRVYGVAAYCWRLLVLVGLSIAASRLFHGMGLLIAVVAVALWVVLPAYDFIKRLPVVLQASPNAGRRLALSLALLTLAAFAGVFRLSWPEHITAPAVIQYRDQAVIRAATAGFVRQVHVQAGSVVKRGQPLLELENAEVDAELADTRLQIKTLAIRARLYFNGGNLSAFQVVQGQIGALKQRLYELEAERSRLKLTAPRGGIVVARNLNNMQGVYIKRGEDILWIVREDRKTVRLSVDQQDVDVFRRSAGQVVAVDMRRCGQGVFQGRLVSVDPQANYDIPHPALSAAWGGPLDVRPRKTGTLPLLSPRPVSYEFFQPRFAAEVELPETVLATLRAGQLAWVRIRGNHRRVVDIIRQYLAAKTGSV